MKFSRTKGLTLFCTRLFSLLSRSSCNGNLSTRKQVVQGQKDGVDFVLDAPVSEEDDKDKIESSVSEEHTHVFDQEVPSEEYLVTEADCTHAATYYYSCLCGEKGENTFEYGEPLGHEYYWYYDTDASGVTTKWIECSRCNEIYISPIVLDETSAPNLVYEVTDPYNRLCEIVGYQTYYNNEKDDNLIIPEFINGYFVDGIADNAFKGCNNLKTITLPEIDENTPVSLSYIRDSAFEGCANLTTINFPETRRTLGKNCFKGCSSLNGLLLPENLSVIGDNCFFGCSSLESLNIPANVTNIGKGITSYCQKRTSLTVDPANRAYSSDNGKNVIFDTFSNTLLAGCSSSERPDSIETISDFAFEGISGLKTITLPSSLKVIGKGSFRGCSSLSSISIPASVEKIGTRAFDSCSSRTSRTVEASNPNYESPSNSNAIIEKSTKTLISGCSTTKIPDDVKKIGNYSFKGRSKLNEITIPENVSTIGDCAFEDCSSLKKINNSNQVTKIGDSSFEGCSLLESFARNDSIKHVPASAFRFCYALSSIKLPKNLASIGSYAFNQCGALSSIDLPSSLEQIGYSAFEGTGLTSILIPAQTSKIGIRSFASIPALVSRKVDSQNQYFDSGNNGNCIYEKATNSLLAGCSTTVVPSTTEKISPFAFSGCSYLTSIALPASLKKIGYYAFASCYSLENIVIPNNVTEIGFRAFFFCRSLTTITIPSSIRFIERYTFDECSFLSDIYYGSTEEDYQEIVILEGNDPFKNATVHYTER